MCSRRGAACHAVAVVVAGELRPAMLSSVRRKDQQRARPPQVRLCGAALRLPPPSTVALSFAARAQLRVLLILLLPQLYYCAFSCACHGIGAAAAALVCLVHRSANAAEATAAGCSVPLPQLRVLCHKAQKSGSRATCCVLLGCREVDPRHHPCVPARVNDAARQVHASSSRSPSCTRGHAVLRVRGRGRNNTVRNNGSNVLTSGSADDEASAAPTGGAGTSAARYGRALNSQSRSPGRVETR
jgi:hypothetical protein